MPRPLPLQLLALSALLMLALCMPRCSAEEECALPAGFVRLSAFDPRIAQELRYATSHNFLGRPARGYQRPECILSIPAARALKRVQSYLLSGAASPDGTQALSLKVYDCYRPTAAIADFLNWSRDPRDPGLKGEFFPEHDKGDLFQLGYIAERSGHSRGSTVDLTIIPLPAASQPEFRAEHTELQACTAPRGERWPDNSLDMGAGFDCFSARSWTNDTKVGMPQQWNRMRLLHAMEKEGFVNYPLEFWHFTLRDEPFPDQYFDFPVC